MCEKQGYMFDYPCWDQCVISYSEGVPSVYFPNYIKGLPQVHKIAPTKTPWHVGTFGQCKPPLVEDKRRILYPHCSLESRLPGVTRTWD